MRPSSFLATGAVTTPPFPLDTYIAPFQLGLGFTTANGAVNYKIQYTYDNPFDGSTMVWFDHPVIFAKTGSFDSVINGAAVTAIRMVNTDVGTVRCRVVQAGGGL